MPLTWFSHYAKLLFSSLVTIFAVITVMFLMLELAPGDPLQALVGEAAVPEQFRAEVSAEFGLDKSLPERYLIYLANIAQGDLGYSYANRTPVSELIIGRLGNTLLLTIPSLLISSVGGVLLGAAAGRTRVRWKDGLISSFAVAGFSIPGFWLALLLIMLFSIHWGLLPAQGMAEMGRGGVSIEHLILPVASLSLAELAFKARIMRTTVIEVLGQDYIDTARSKGLSKREIVRNHGYLNSMVPMVSVIGYSMGFTIAGAVAIEKVFSWPGMGQLLFTSIQKGENMVVMGVLLVITVFVLIVNFLTDIVYGIVDPRIRARRSAERQAA